MIFSRGIAFLFERDGGTAEGRKIYRSDFAYDPPAHLAVF
jgi:hypothetical protein